MKELFTHEYLQQEREAGRLLDIYDRIPDDFFVHQKSSIELIVRKLKGFARVYQNISLNGADSEIIIN
ncbi:hypothetical protein [Carboxylicivirga caseinilyticus]|uniref:hypothetical protein n=1 Tax=Carboxylicivirga caseinilyticus TaxID=3417572 RepID=UPI003D3482AC|nr:hypothetical protein [Marinilabiliaceae bacterium A049]